MRQQSDLVCSSGTGRTTLSGMALSEVERRMNKGGEEGSSRWRDAEGRAVVPHGFRSTSRRSGHKSPFSESAGLLATRASGARSATEHPELRPGCPALANSERATEGALSSMMLSYGPAPSVTE
jgi:hypothetical protein